MAEKTHFNTYQDVDLIRWIKEQALREQTRPAKIVEKAVKLYQQSLKS